MQLCTPHKTSKYLLHSSKCLPQKIWSTTQIALQYGLTNIKWAVSRNRAIVAGLKVHWIGKGWKGAIAFAVTVAMIAFQVDHNGKSGLKIKGTAMHANCYLETTHCNRDAFVFSPIKDLCCHALRFHALGQLIQLWGFLGCLLPMQCESEDDLAAIDVFFFDS